MRFLKNNRFRFVVYVSLLIAVFAAIHTLQIKAQNTVNNGTTELITSNSTDSTPTNTQYMLSEEEAEEALQTPTSLFSLFKMGGPFMWALLLVSVFGLAFIIERTVFYIRNTENIPQFQDELSAAIKQHGKDYIRPFCNNHQSAVSRIVLEGYIAHDEGLENFEKELSRATSIEVTKMEKGLNMIASISNIAPMLGFLGTVSGMIHAFTDIANADQVSARIVAGGISEALITTATGLIIAIPTSFAFNTFVSLTNTFIANIERLSSQLVKQIFRGDKISKNDIINHSSE